MLGLEAVSSIITCPNVVIVVVVLLFFFLRILQRHTFLFIYLLGGVLWCSGGGPRTTREIQFSLSTIWIPGINRAAVLLGQAPFTHGAISLAVRAQICNYIRLLYLGLLV